MLQKFLQKDPLWQVMVLAGQLIKRRRIPHQKQLEQYRSGKTNLFGFFVGQVMKETKGQANPQKVNELLQEELEKQ